MAAFTIRLSERIMRRWIMKATEILKEEGYGINIDNIINAIDTELSLHPLGKNDKDDIKKYYNEMKGVQ